VEPPERHRCSDLRFFSYNFIRHAHSKIINRIGTRASIVHSERNGGTMPLYYFNTIHEDQRNDRDDPIDLPDDKTAWSEAVAAFGEMLKEIDGSLKPNIEWRLDVKDGAQKLIYSLRLTPESYL
jgi:hypothetical protein